MTGPYPLYRVWLGPFANAGLFALPLAWLVVRSLRHRRSLGKEEKLLWFFVLSFLIVYSVPSQRQENYLLPVMPALAVLLGLHWKRIERPWLTLFSIPILVTMAFLFRLMLTVRTEVLGPGGYAAWQLALPPLTMTLAALPLVFRGAPQRLFHTTALTSLLSLSASLAPFEGPAGRFQPERIAALKDQTVYVPTEFISKHERHRFLLPGARILGYDPSDIKRLSSLLESRHFVVLHRPLIQSLAGPYRVIARRLDLRSRQTPSEIARILFHRDLSLLVRQELIVRRYRARRERGELPS